MAQKPGTSTFIDELRRRVFWVAEDLIVFSSVFVRDELTAQFGNSEKAAGLREAIAAELGSLGWENPRAP